MREAGLEELTKDQLKAFSFYWEQYVKDVFEMSPEEQSTMELVLEERRENPAKAEEWKDRLKEIFDQNSIINPGLLTEEECLYFLAARSMLARFNNTGRVAPFIEEERHENYGRREYQAIASLANDRINVSFENIIRTE